MHVATEPADPVAQDGAGDGQKPCSLLGFEPSDFCIEWNAENQLTRVTKDGAEMAAFAYDPLKRRVEKIATGVTTTYAYDGEDMLREVRGASTFRHVHGASIDEPIAREDGSGTLTYYHADGLGSVAKRTNQTGAVVHEYRYDAWGSIEAGAGEPGYAFTGRERDPEVGLYYYRARYYDPHLGRFISEDPIGFAVDVNFYAYVQNNPANFTDPLGLFMGAVPYPPRPNPIGQGMGGLVEGMGATTDFVRNYVDMRKANTIGADRYFHCMANCQAARRGDVGRVVSEVMSEGREITDEYVKGDPKTACDADRAANDAGRNGDPTLPCPVVCAPYRPNGLPPQY